MNAVALKLASVGWLLLFIDLAIFAGLMTWLIVYTFRQGQRDDEEGKVITSWSLPGSTDPTVRGISKQKIFVSRTKFVSMKSIVNGTATKQEVRFAIAITGALIAFSLLFPCFALINLPSAGPSILFLMLVPFAFAWSMWNSMYKDYREAMKKRRRRRGGSSAP